MKADILPTLDDVELLDRTEAAATIQVGLYRSNGHSMVFMAERNRQGPQAIAANSLTYIQQLLDRFGLNVGECDFYRYVYTPASGPMVGRFALTLAGDKPVSYSMKMLTQIELEQLAGVLAGRDNATLPNLAPASSHLAEAHYKPEAVSA